MTDLVSQLVGALERLLNSDSDGAIATASEDELTLAANDMEADPIIREQAASVLQARAALSAAKAGGWVPIETAPKEESVLILRRGDLYPGVAFLSLDRWHWSSSGGWAGHPTHWQPLPTPPKEQS